jgi:hypothetical protein
VRTCPPQCTADLWPALAGTVCRLTQLAGLPLIPPTRHSLASTDDGHACCRRLWCLIEATNMLLGMERAAARYCMGVAGGEAAVQMAWPCWPKLMLGCCSAASERLAALHRMGDALLVVAVRAVQCCVHCTCGCWYEGIGHMTCPAAHQCQPCCSIHVHGGVYHVMMDACAVKPASELTASVAWLSTWEDTP